MPQPAKASSRKRSRSSGEESEASESLKKTQELRQTGHRHTDQVKQERGRLALS